MNSNSNVFSYVFANPLKEGGEAMSNEELAKTTVLAKRYMSGEDFAEMDAGAREMQMELRAEELLEIADDGS